MPRPDASFEAVRLDATPFFPQQQYQCGPAALATVLGASGVSASPEDLRDRVYVPARRGSLQVEMLAATRQSGRVPYRVAPTLDSLASELRAGHPVLVLQNLLLRSLPRWHYAVVIGIDAEHVLLRSGTRRELRMRRAAFERTWRLADHWGFIALPAGAWPGDADPQRWLEAHAALEQTGHTAIAMSGYRLATQRWPGDARFLLALGNLAYEGRDWREATAAYRRAAEVQPEFAPAWNNLAQSLIEQQCRSAALQALARGELVADEAMRQVLALTRRELPAHDGAACDVQAR